MRIKTFALLIGFASMLVTSPTTFAQTKQAKGAVGHSDAAAMLKQDMRKLWTDHVVWTRDYIIAADRKAAGCARRTESTNEESG